MSGGGTFKGIFDNFHFENKDKDDGNIIQKNLKPGIMVAVVPSGITERLSKIRREGWETGDREYTFRMAGLDDEGIPILWLF